MISLFVIIPWMILLFSGFDDSVPPTGDMTFKIETRPDIVESIRIISDEKMPFWGFDIELKQNSTDYLEIMIPKNLPTPASFTNKWYFDEMPFVLANGTEMGYDIIDDPCYNIYKIPISHQTKIEFAYPVILAGTWQLYSPIQFDESHPCYHEVFYEKPVDSPLKQFRAGIPIEEIQCKEGLELVFKTSNEKPACVNYGTGARLLDRGWATCLYDKISYTREHPCGPHSGHPTFDSYIETVIVIIPEGSGNPEKQSHLVPEAITVVLGKNNTVTWVNQDKVSSTLVADDGTWWTEMILPGTSSSVTFNQTGIFGYHGEPHPWKKGKVIVLEEKGNED